MASLYIIIYLLMFLLPSLLILLRIDLDGIFRLLHLDFLLNSFIFTVSQSLWSSILSVIIGGAAGYILALSETKLSSILRGVGLASFMAPPIVVAYGFTLLYGEAGLITQFIPILSFLGTGFSGIVAAHVFYNSPLAMNLVFAGLSGIPRDEFDAMSIYGRNLRYLTRKIFIPYLLPSAFASFLLTFLYSFTSLAIPLVIGGKPSLWTIEAYIYWIMKYLLDTKLAIALTLVQLLIMALFAYLYLYFSKSLISPEISPYRIGFLRGWQRYISLSYLIILLLYLVMPFISILYSSFRNPYTNTFTLEGYMEVFGGRFSNILGTSHINILINTFYYAFMVTIISISLSIVLSYLNNMYLNLSALLPLAFSPVTLGLGMYLFYLNVPEFRWVAIVAAHVAASLPLVSRSIDIGFTRIPKELLEASEVFNVRGLYRLLKVILPLMKEPLMIAASLALVVSLGEFGATLLLHNPQTTTLSIAIYKLRAARRFMAASAEASILMAITMIILIYIARKSGRWI